MRSRVLGAALALATAGASLAGLTTTQAVVTTTSSTTGDPGLAAVLDPLLDDRRLTDSIVGLVVRDAATGETLYERNPDTRLNPASNAKLFTSAAAMERLGPDHTYLTRVLADGPVNGGALRGDLVLRGAGDPAMLAEDYASLARQVADAGIRTVIGDLVADDSVFDDVPLGRGWAWDDEPFYYSAVTSALTVAPDTDYDSGTVIVESGPGDAVGQPASVALVPGTDVLDVVNRATTAPAGSDNTISIERQHASDLVLVTGSVPLDDGVSQEWVTVPDPTAYAADVFARALRAEGVRVQGGVTEGTAEPGAAAVATHRSMTLSELLVPFMKLSNNMHAEALVKTLGADASGRPGSWSNGLAAVTSYIASEGVDVSGLRLSDGSGLSRFDLVSADDIADLLVATRDEPWYDAWYASLPVAGNPERFVGGTLRSRMRNTPAADNLRGKTGSLTSVTALSGYVTDADGRDLVFSMVSNNYLASPRSIEDAVGVALASYSQDGADAPAVTPQRLRQRTDYGPAGIECSWAKAC